MITASHEQLLGSATDPMNSPSNAPHPSPAPAIDRLIPGHRHDPSASAASQPEFQPEFQPGFQPESFSEGAGVTVAGLDRRRFIGILLGLLAGQQTPVVAAMDNLTGPARSTAASAGQDISSKAAARLSPGALMAPLTDQGAAAWLGERYLADHPQERDLDRLIERIMAALGNADWAITAETDAIRQALTDLIQRESISEPLPRVAGWPLAPSEARLYAIAALSATWRETSGQEHPQEQPSCSTA
jgi:hypothetical protein